jgi:hypothetical protein
LFLPLSLIHRYLGVSLFAGSGTRRDRVRIGARGYLSLDTPGLGGVANCTQLEMTVLADVFKIMDKATGWEMRWAFKDMKACIPEDG